MVNLDKWEVISYDDIKKGDTIRIVTKQGSVLSDTRGTVGFKGSGSWDADNRIRLVVSDAFFLPVDNGSRTIYRRKPQFKVPQGLGAVVTAKDGAKVLMTFVRADHDTDCWRETKGDFFLSDSGLKDFTDHVVHSEGVVL